jgi:hypothetical protein
MFKLWIVMTEAYGFKWFKPMGETPNQTWVEGLRELTTEQWHSGLRMLSRSTDEWPPSLPEFRRWCTAQRTKEQLRAFAEAKAESEVANRISKYNPNVIPMTYDQAAREQSRLSRQIYVQEQENERRLSLGLETIDDPRRICMDEELL